MRHITLQKNNGIATLTLNSVDESMNVVSPAWIDELNAAIAEVKDDASVTGHHHLGQEVVHGRRRSEDAGRSL